MPHRAAARAPGAPGCTRSGAHLPIRNLPNLIAGRKWPFGLAPRIWGPGRPLMQTGLGCENRAGRVISSSRASGCASKSRMDILAIVTMGYYAPTRRRDSGSNQPSRLSPCCLARDLPEAFGDRSGIVDDAVGHEPRPLCIVVADFLRPLECALDGAQAALKGARRCRS